MAPDETPPALDEVDELDDYWTESTTITVSRYTKAQLDEHREGRPWDEFLEMLRREHADPITFNDAQQIVDFINEEVALREGVDADAIASRVSERIDYAHLADRVAENVAQELEGMVR